MKAVGVSAQLHGRNNVAELTFCPVNAYTYPDGIIYVTGSAIARTNAHTGISVCQTYIAIKSPWVSSPRPPTPITST